MRFLGSSVFGLLTLLFIYIASSFIWLAPLVMIGGFPCFVLFLIFFATRPAPLISEVN
jgi:hypothetical protein